MTPTSDGIARSPLPNLTIPAEHNNNTNNNKDPPPCIPPLAAPLRKLASVRTITTTRRIPGTGYTLCKVDQWQVACRHNAHKDGDPVLYCEVDAFLPSSDARFRAHANSFTTWGGNRGYHVRSAMYGSDLSQGVVFALSAFPEIKAELDKRASELGDVGAALAELRAVDFAEALAIKKWEQPPAAKAGLTKSLGGPPAFVVKTDLERVQNIPPPFFSKYQHAEFQETVKLDGMAVSVYWVRNDSPFYLSLPAVPDRSPCLTPSGRIGVCTKNHDLAPDDRSVAWDLVRRLHLGTKLDSVGRNILIQGELCGDFANGNHEMLPRGQTDLFVFKMVDLDGMATVAPREVERRASVVLGMRHVPVLRYAKLGDIARCSDELVARADGPGMLAPLREGIILRNVSDGRALKAISNKYLLSKQQ